MTTTPRITTDELIYLADGIAAYRQARDTYKWASRELYRVSRHGIENHDTLYTPSAYHAAASEHRAAADALAMQRTALEDEGIDWSAIDSHDGIVC